ncbi:MAG: hypothetical protein IPJ86_06225 [Bacteroidetes bacterium]|nr:hypothetical protein [Bacteroidota bacterium]
MDAFSKIGDTVQIGYVYGNIAEMKLKTGDTTSALLYFDKYYTVQGKSMEVRI